jgi:hypothetical protein
MPKTRTETWQTCAKPQTPLQRGAFIDLCTRWLVAAESSDGSAADGVLGVCTTYPVPDLRENARGALVLGLTHTELRARTRACAMCDRADADDVAAVVANPFAQCPLALVCAACRDA